MYDIFPVMTYVFARSRICCAVANVSIAWSLFLTGFFFFWLVSRLQSQPGSLFINDSQEHSLPFSVMKEAKRKGHKAWVSYDTLYIDCKPVKDESD